MQVGQIIRRTGSGIASASTWLADRFSLNERGTGWRLTRKVMIGAVVFVFFYYVVGMWLMHRIDDDTAYTFPAADFSSGGSRAVAISAALIEREINEHGWVSNDPFFMPSVFNDNMRHYQQGMLSAVYRFAAEMRDFLGRARGSSAEDSDLTAAQRLSYDPRIWYWNPTQSILPKEPSEQAYLDATAALKRYNARLAGGAAVYDRRADNLADALDRISKDIGGATANLFQMANDRPGWFLFDWQSDDTFYEAKGKAYAYFMILRELREDFERIIAEKELGTTYNNTLESLQAAVALDPFVVVNGRPGDQWVPNHLVTMGFNLERARTQLREIASILRA